MNKHATAGQTQQSVTVCVCMRVCVCVCSLARFIICVSHIKKNNRINRPNHWITTNSADLCLCYVSNIVHIIWKNGTYYVIVKVFLDWSYMHVHLIFYRKKCCKGFKFVLGQCIPEGRGNCLDVCLVYLLVILFWNSLPSCPVRSLVL